MKLTKIEETGKISSRKVGGRAKVWFTNNEIVEFFPSRREIFVKNRSEKTEAILSQLSHIVDSNDSDGYLYKISKEDVWNSPYDSVESLINDIISVVGEESWRESFEMKLKEEWENAHLFRLYTSDEGFSVLEAKNEKEFENTAKRVLEYNTHYIEFLNNTEMRIKSGAEANVKEVLYEAGYPVVYERRLEEGEVLDVKLDEDLSLRDYQQEWVSSFENRGSGVFVGPSGSGKTIAAIGVIERMAMETLILVPRRELVDQWKEELVEHTTLTTRQIGEYHGNSKQIRPITIATYTVASMSRHRSLFNEREWGLVIADEAHHSVSDTWKRFREIQSKSRLGLSATPVREAQDSKEIYTLIGPPIGTDWGSLFIEGWVEKPTVSIINVPWKSDKLREKYRNSDGINKLMIAAQNSKKIPVIKELFERHSSEKIIVFVDWIDQGKSFSSKLDIPFIYGETPFERRNKLYQKFRNDEIDKLMVSRVGDEGIDLPDAEVAILASTRGSSRSQTGQRSGRTMRPSGNSKVYILLTEGSGEEDWGRESTRF